MPLPQTFLDKLKARQVVPFVGAGVSMAVKDKVTNARLFPSWGELLKAAEEKLRNDGKLDCAESIHVLLDDRDYLGAARWADEGLKGQLPDLIKKQIDKLRDDVQENSLELARLIWRLDSPLIITTNYDRVLEWSSPQPGNCKRLLNRNNYELAAIQKGTSGSETVWHLHGHIDDADSLILTPESYVRLYPNTQRETDWKAALETLRHVMTAKSLLFIGYGMGDVQIIEQLQQTGKIFEGAPGPHYVLATNDYTARIKAKGLPVEPISYEKHGGPLLELLREIIKEMGVASGIATTSASVNSPSPNFNPQHPSFNVPYRQKGSQVLGREEQLKSVREQLTSGIQTRIGHTASFEGMGGLGKTQLAVEYAYKFRDQYPYGVVWINADGDIDSQLIELAQKSRWFAPESDHKSKLDIALHRVHSYSDCLLIFDNVIKVEDIKPYLPEPSANPHILITSRLPQFGFTSVSLDVLPAEISLQLLIQEANCIPTNEDEFDHARQIVGMLGNLPLAIELAGAFISYRRVGWQQYVDLLRNDFKRAMPSGFSSFTDHEANIYHTLQVDEAIFEEEPILRDVLDVLTWSGPAPMGIDLLSHLLDVKPFQLTSALALGRELRLLQQTSDSGNYAIHRLVRQVRQAEIPLLGRAEWGKTMAQRLGDWFESKRQDFAHLSEFEREIEHLIIWQEQATQIAPQESSRLLWLQSYPPLHQGRYRESKGIVEKALRTYRDTEDEDRRLEAHLLADLGRLQRELGSFAQALNCSEKALLIRREFLADNHNDIASSLSALGDVHRELGKPLLSLKFYEEARSIWETEDCDSDGSLSFSTCNIGLAYRDLGYFNKCLDLYKESLFVQKEKLGENHPVVAITLNNIGLAHSDLGQRSKCLDYYQRAISIQKATLGEKHPVIATTLNNIGMYYSDLGDVKEFLFFCGQALDLRRETLGEGHPDFAISLNNVAGAYRTLGEKEKSLDFHEKALIIQRNCLGDEHPSLALTLNNIALLLSEKGMLRDSLENYEKALLILKKAIGESHPDTAICLSNMASAQWKIGANEDALLNFQQAYSVLSAQLGYLHPKALIALRNLAPALESSKRYDEAFGILDKTLSALDLGDKLFQRLEEIAIRVLPNAKKNARISYATLTLMYKRKWRKTDSKQIRG